MFDEMELGGGDQSMAPPNFRDDANNDFLNPANARSPLKTDDFPDYTNNNNMLPNKMISSPNNIFSEVPQQEPTQQFNPFK